MFDGLVELLLALPEHNVALDGGNRDSQNDVFALIRYGDQTRAATIEGKVSEPFGPPVGEWFAQSSQQKRDRMRQLCGLLCLDEVPPSHIRYQLMHRDEAAMIVHSFSPTRMWFEEFASFARLLGAEAERDQSSTVTLKSGQRLRLGWATGNEDFLAC
ncbi:hypothetical protein NKI72_19680 [Mesorhizobium sp. M0437]|uniref:DUF6946 family protein n=1 Tax=Mesorhizobium sp. M0437 TaxID=2956945 RepID=UPI0033375E2C